jgi:hypothetical protein
MSGVEQEGWYTDPFGVHEARWLSRGTPTKPVRDGQVESFDDPPSRAPTQVPEPIVAARSPSAGDLRRADDEERQGYDPGRLTRAAWDGFDELQG